MKKKEIMIAEDDSNLGTILSEYLEAKGFSVRLCKDGQSGFELFAHHDFDLCILDIMMPVKDGFTLAKEIRKINKKIPIIFLTAKAMKDDRIQGFKIGGDDYVTKPFSMEELLYRIHAIFKRMEAGTAENNNKQTYRIGKYTFDPKRQLLILGKQRQKLSSKESELLKLLCINKNEVLDRTYTLKAVWEDDSYFNARSMDVYITKLRKYLKDDPGVEIINIRGRGFRLTTEH